MADTAPASYPTSASPRNLEQQFAQHQYAYQARVNSPGGQFFNGANGSEQQIQENVEQQVPLNQGQEVNYGQSGFSDQSNAGIMQQYTGAAGQLAQQQGPNGYKINFDPNPQIIRKQANDAVTYKQEVAVRYLRPPTPPPPGPLIIKEVR